MITSRTRVRCAALTGTALFWSVAAAAQTPPASSPPPAAPAPAAPADEATGPATPQPTGQETAAQSAYGNGDADIVITARARTERLVDVPVAATVLTPAALARNAVLQVSDIAKQVPQLEINVAGAGNGANITLRGVGSSSIDAGIEQPVSLVIDGVGTSRGRLIFLGLFDVQAVEALKGPQALFFGKNSPAGVLSLTTTSPGREFEGYLKGSYNFRDHARYVEGAVSVPLSDTFAVRVAGRVLDSRGWLRNLAVPQPDPVFRDFNGNPVMTRPAAKWQAGGSSEIARVTARWEPTDDFDATAKFTAAWQRSDGSASQATIVRCAPGRDRPGLAIGIPGYSVDPTGTCGVDYTVSTADLPIAGTIPLDRGGRQFEDGRTLQGTLVMNYRAGNVTLTSLTGYTDFQYLNAGNFDYQSFAVLWGALRDDMKAFSQEIRAASDFDGPLNFTAGALYEHTDRVFAQDVKVPGFAPDINGRYDNAYSVDTTKGNTYSAYLQLNYKLMEDLELAGGARFTREIKKGTLQNIYVRPGNAVNIPVGEVRRPEVAASNLSPEVTLSWHPVRNSTIYGAYKTGFLSGGISNPGNLQVSATDENLVFRPVTVRGWEVGAKGLFLDDRLSLTSAAYLYNFKNLQVISFDPDTFNYFTKNAASAQVKGIEAQANFRATRELTVRGGLSYNHGRYKEFPNGQCYAGQPTSPGEAPVPGTCVRPVGAPPTANGIRQDLSGTQLGASPDWAGNFGATYEADVADGWRAAVNVDGFYRGKYNFTAANTYRPTAIQNGQVRMDASVRLFQEGKGFDIGLVMRNITKRITILSGSDTPAGIPGQVSGTLARPREAIIEATFRF